MLATAVPRSVGLEPFGPRTPFRSAPGIDGAAWPFQDEIVTREKAGDENEVPDKIVVVDSGQDWSQSAGFMFVCRV